MKVWLTALAVSLSASAAQLPASRLANGHKIAQITGCISCHGEKLDGHLVEEDPAFVLLWSSNLSRQLSSLDDATLEHTLRTGTRRDGSALWFMPTFVHARLSPDDMRDLTAWLRTVPPTGADHPPMKRGPQFAAALTQGMEDSAAQAARLSARSALDVGPAHARGRYLAQIACSECHGPELHGARNPAPGQAPDLAAAAGYDPVQFHTLLRTGRGPGGRTLGAMTQYGPERFIGLTDDDIEAIRGYLAARSRNAPAGAPRDQPMP